MEKSHQTSVDGSDEYDEVLKVVALRLKEARQHKGLTQKEVADKAGLKQSYVFELETGRTNITLRTLAKMADVLELDISDLLPERKSASVSPAAFAILGAVLEKLIAVLQEREQQAAKREAIDSELLAELKSFAALKIPLERAAQSMHESPTKETSRSKAGRPGGEASHRGG